MGGWEGREGGDGMGGREEVRGEGGRRWEVREGGDGR